MDFTAARLACVVAMAMASAGCDEPATSCEDASDPCETPEARRCSEDLAEVQVCREVEGCRVWTTEVGCAGEEQCAEGGDDAQCLCPSDDLCDTVGESACSGDVLRRCVEGEVCRLYVEEEDCTDSGGLCRGDAGEAACVPGCAGCEEGERRCREDVVEVCALGMLSCLVWLAEDDCTARGEVCDEDRASPTCHAPCVGGCDVEGEGRCDAAVAQSCEMVGECLRWVNVEACDARRMACEVADGVAECVCSGFCVEGETRCHEEDIDTCVLRADGCFDWSKIFDCVDGRWHCAEVATGRHGCVGGTGDDCGRPLAVFSLPLSFTGDDFVSDFSDALRLSDGSCPGADGVAEAVLGVYLLAGEVLLVEVVGGAPLGLALVEGSCDEAASCAASATSVETLRYEATADGVVWLVAELEPGASAPIPYEVSLSLE